MDEFIDELLREDRACDIILPRIQVGFTSFIRHLTIQVMYEYIE